MKSKVLMAIASIFILLMFLFPIWKITLQAPQYPAGLEMSIWINKLTAGHDNNDLRNINLMNHYVGMKQIHADSIPELTYFQYIIGFMGVIGLIVVFAGKKILYLIWSLILGVLGVAGVVDFKSWLYDYGHTLNSHAPIKIPGAAYDPPLFGDKQMLNFYVTSYPSPSTFLMIFAIALAFAAFYYAKKKQYTKLA